MTRSYTSIVTQDTSLISYQLLLIKSYFLSDKNHLFFIIRKISKNKFNKK